MNEKTKQEAAHAMQLISMLNVSGDGVDVVAAARQALRNIMAICDATAPPAGEKGDAPDEAKGAAKNETA